MRSDRRSRSAPAACLPLSLAARRAGWGVGLAPGECVPRTWWWSLPSWPTSLQVLDQPCDSWVAVVTTSVHSPGASMRNRCGRMTQVRWMTCAWQAPRGRSPWAPDGRVWSGSRAGRVILAACSFIIRST